MDTDQPPPSWTLPELRGMQVCHEDQPDTVFTVQQDQSTQLYFLVNDAQQTISIDSAEGLVPIAEEADQEEHGPTRGIVRKSKTTRSVIDALTNVEYGERTWKTAQTVRDLFQNHLDAHTEQYFDQLVGTVLDIDALQTMELTETEQETLNEFCYAVFRFVKSCDDLSPDAKKEFQSILETAGKNFPIRDTYTQDGTIDIQEMEIALRGIEETKPEIRYKVVDSRGGSSSEAEWVTAENLKQPPYDETVLDGSEECFRFRITAVEVEDSGSGFDAKLTEFYKSTKADALHLRGRFGEGIKMNFTHLLRNGANVKMRSRFAMKGEQQKEGRLWQRKPYIGSDNKVYLKSVEVAIPQDTDDTRGSSTSIDIENADARFQEEFRKNIDPRNPHGLATNCLEYSPHQYHYPVTKLYAGDEKPELLASIGVSTTNDPSCQYLQGLRIEDTEQYFQRIFSYNILDPTLLKGRDRNQMKDELSKRLYNFWHQAESPELLRVLVQRALIEFEEDSVRNATTEMNALLGIMSGSILLRNPQAVRTQKMLFAMLPELLGLEEEKLNIVASKREIDDTENGPLLRVLKNKGHNVIQVGVSLQGDVFDAFNAFHQGKYPTRTLESARRHFQEQSSLLPQEHPAVIGTKETVEGAQSELCSILQQAGVAIGEDAFSVQYLETVDATVEEPVEAKWSDETQSFEIVVRPEVLLAKIEDGKGLSYWKKRIQMELLCTLARESAFPDRRTARQHAQRMADELMESTLQEHSSDVHALPQSFDHSIDLTKKEGAKESLVSTPEELEASIRGWHAYEKVNKFGCTIDELEQMANALDTFPPNYRKEIEDTLENRIIVENGEVGYCTTEYSQKDGRYIPFFHRQELSTLEPVGELDGDKVYKVDSKIFVPFNTPIAEGSVITNSMGSKYLYYHGALLYYELESDVSPRFDNVRFQYGWNLHNGCFSVHTYYGQEDEIGDLKSAVDDFQFDAPERGKRNAMHFTEGTVKTPLPLEYGKDEWDNPIRVFQDKLQNHIDASPDGSTQLAFEVLRDGKRVWIVDSEMVKEDRIVGFRARDNGEGYPPDDIGTMGKSSKKSPIFGGKYGEGQKMMAAAAARKGLELQFSSTTQGPSSSPVRWTATVGTEEESVIVKGKPTSAQRVVFNVQSKSTVLEKETYRSETVLRIPESIETRDDPELEKWFSIVDPRNTDERGNGGLSRYVINLREQENPNIIDLGYMRILLDEPGAVYENGLLIGRKPEENALGYDVPEIVTTRERNAWDDRRLQTYISHALEHTTDPRFIDTLVQELKKRYLAKMTSEQGGYIREVDLNIGQMFRGKRFIASLPYWRAAFDKHFPGYVVHSDAGLTHSLDGALSHLEWAREHDDTEDIGETERRIHDICMVMANIGHIPKDEILRVSEDYYDGFKAVLPSAEERLQRIARQEVPVPNEILQKLYTVVAASAVEIQQVIQDMEQRDLVLLQSITSEEEPSSIVPEEAQADLEKVREQLNFWTDRQQVAASPKSVFVSPHSAGYHGIAEPRSIGINENLLLPENRLNLVETIRHELLHSITGLRDYTPEFIILLLEIADRNTKTAKA